MSCPTVETVQLGNKIVGSGHPCYIIAEAGTAHQGNIHRAEALIKAAKSAGADAVKFQWFYAHELVHPDTGLVQLPGGAIPLFRRFRQLEQPLSFLASLKRICEKEQITFLCTPFGLKSLEDLLKLQVSGLKIASPELNHLPLLRESAKSGLPIILSTGVSTLGDIEEAVTELNRAKLCLLHCVTAYPAPPSDYNIRVISTLREVFGLPVGLSDHSEDPILVPTLGTMEQAAVIEKHLALNHSDGGLDDPFALEPNDFKNMVLNIRKMENDKTQSLKHLESVYSEKSINEVLGSGIKTLGTAEISNYATTNRSIMTIQSIKKGDRVSHSNAALLRSEKQLSPGLHPRFFDLILGKKASTDIPNGTGIHWDHLTEG